MLAAVITVTQVMNCDKIYFLIHPMDYLWDSPLHPFFCGNFKEYQTYCNEISRKWRRKISNLGNNEVLFIISTWPASSATEEIEQFARKEIGPRCIVAHKVEPVDKNYYQKLGKTFMEKAGKEIIAANELRKGSWGREEIGTAIGSLAYAEDIRIGLQNSGYSLDPEKVEAEAWGQAFEGCVAKYAAMIGKYLNLSRPIEINFEMSIPDARFAWLNSKFVERMQLADSCYLFLFETGDKQPFGLFLEGFHALRDEFRVARVPIDPGKFELRNKYVQLRWPRQDINKDYANIPYIAEGKLQIPVGIGLNAENESLYIFGKGMTLAKLRKTLGCAGFRKI